MVVQRKNLLEAFRHAGSTPTQEPEPSAGPFARPEPSGSVRSAPGLSLPALPAWLPWGIGVALAFVFGIAVGRISAPGEAVAAGEGPGALGALDVERVPARVRVPAVEETTPRTRGESAAESSSSPPLMDANNRYTLIAATYSASRQDFAWATHDYLRDEGFEVWPLVERGANILVLVGAAPTVSELTTTLGRLTRLASWDGTPAAFADAYAEQIDRLIER